MPEAGVSDYCVWKPAFISTPLSDCTSAQAFRVFRLLESTGTTRSASSMRSVSCEGQDVGRKRGGEGREPPPRQGGYTLQTFDVGAGYFTTMGTVLLRGREFAPSEREGAALVAIINQTMADQFWPGQNPVGRRLFEGRPGQGDSYEIVGVVETGKYRTLGENQRPVVFRSRLQHPRPRSTFVAHVRGDPQAALRAIREVTRALDSRLSLSRLETLDRH